MVSVLELKSLRDEAMLVTAKEWRRAVLQGEKAFLLAKRKKEEELLVRGPAQTALLNEFTLSLDENERAEIYAEVRDANPMAGANELGSLLRAAKVQKALAWCRKRNQGRKDFSLPFAGTERTLLSLLQGRLGSPSLSRWKHSRRLVSPRQANAICLSPRRREFL